MTDFESLFGPLGPPTPQPPFWPRWFKALVLITLGSLVWGFVFAVAAFL
jgi:hypothetical protein